MFKRPTCTTPMRAPKAHTFRRWGRRQPAPQGSRSTALQPHFMAKLATTIGLLLCFGLFTVLIASAQETPETPTQQFQIFLPLIQANPVLPGGDDNQNVGGIGEISWDPRLDDRGAVLVRAVVAPGEGYWRLVAAQWFDVEESQGRHHILIDTLTVSDDRAVDVPVLISWADGNNTVRTELKPGEPFATNYAMYALAPAYSAQPNDGAPADRLENMGLGNVEQPHLAHHTSYGLTWQWTIAAAVITPTVTPSATVIITATPSVTITPTVTTTPIVTITPISTITPTIIVTPGTVTATPTPSATPTFTPTPSPTPSPTPTATVTPTTTPDAANLAFAATVGTCTPSVNGTRVEGHVYVDDVLADGYAITYSFPGRDRPVPLQPAISGRGFRPGFYDFDLQPGTWTVWMIDDTGEPISTVATVAIIGDGACDIATVDFRNQ